MYIYINNPITKKKINIYSNLGRSIIKSYIDYINKQTRGGAPRSTRMDIGKEEQLLRKLARKEIIKARDAKTERKREDLTIEIINKLKEKQYKDSDINEAIREVGIRLQRPTKEAQVKRIKNFITLKNKKYSINEINEAMKEALKRCPLMQEVEQIENYIIQKRIQVIDPADIIDAAARAVKAEAQSPEQLRTGLRVLLRDLDVEWSRHLGVEVSARYVVDHNLTL